MSFSTTFHTLAITLVPGVAEYLGRETAQIGNTKGQETARKIKHARNALYLTSALTLISSIGAYLTDENSETKKLALTTVAAIGGTFAIFAGKTLYNQALVVKQSLETVRMASAVLAVLPERGTMLQDMQERFSFLFANARRVQTSIGEIPEQVERNITNRNAANAPTGLNDPASYTSHLLDRR